MRLTSDLITASLSYINPLKERELDLRGHKIPTIENLGVARDQDAIDFTDNAIATLSNFPLSPRLNTLLLARNRVNIIAPNLHTLIPNLTTLVLTENRITNLADLDPLGSFKRLTTLVLIGNPITRKQHYRLWVIWRCRAVRFLDFARVRDVERTEANTLFGEDEKNMTPLAKQISLAKSAGGATISGADDDTEMDGTGSGGKVKLTDKEKKRVQQMIRNAKSLGDIGRLEKELEEGRIPGGVLADDDDDDDDDAMEE
ncbi:small nuclear ribonucleoprotein U2, A [Microthyrium microscopicum]|uniref:U2 small nuclear ribonucleoprotein A' n=1 Tax=Microthyrium microscopicum TaxID=703497 RepID=A0A6A6UN60_9PEZI|nr:small nuclear ribonucleoprotein U2, A [Microthyrium microscopicum]